MLLEIKTCKIKSQN